MVLPAEATNTNVIWSSSDEAIVTVSEFGELTAIMEGEATITVKTEDGNFTATAVVTVTKMAVAVTGITLDPSNLSLVEGASQLLQFMIVPADATNTNVSWSSDDEATATVSSSGEVTAVTEGETTIRVRTEDGDFAANSIVTVTKDNISVIGLTVSPSTLEMQEGTTQALTYNVLPANATNTNVSWSSDDTAIATVDQWGVVTAIIEGVATISATTEDGNFTENVVVKQLRNLEKYWLSRKERSVLPCKRKKGISRQQQPLRCLRLL